MEREYYRRYTPSRLYEKPQAPAVKTNDYREKLIVQGIISGIILTVVLFLSVVDNPWTLDMRIQLGQAISGHISAEQVAGQLRVVLGGETETSQLPAEPLEAAPSGRIDEDILRELGISEVEELKITAPEPMIPPEL